MVQHPELSARPLPVFLRGVVVGFWRLKWSDFRKKGTVGKLCTRRSRYNSYRRDTRKWGPGLGIRRPQSWPRLKSRGGGVPKPGSAARNATPRSNLECEPCGASITTAARPHSATAPATAHEREDIDLVGEPLVKKRMILPKTFEGSLYGCAALGGAHGLFGRCHF
eukprot:363631-Chlamydomonas_euryale.AAC.15